MRMLLGIAGLMIIAFTVLDIIWTTLGRGGGPITCRVSSRFWKAALYFHHSSPSPRLLSITGVSIILTVIGLWIFLIWIGWTLVFSIDKQAVVAAESGEPADMIGRFYFAGDTLWTLGTGNLSPQGPLWQIATVLAAVQGFFLVAIGVTFLLSVISAVTEKRQLAAYISSLGNTGDEIVLRAWNGKDCRMLEQHLIALAPLLARLEQIYLSYPLLHYLHTTERNSAAAPSIAALDEALTIIEHGLKKECRPDPAAFYPVRQTIWELLKTLDMVFVKSATEAPTIPPLGRLRSGGISTVGDEEFRAALDNLTERRKLLFTFVKNDGWFWNDVE